MRPAASRSWARSAGGGLAGRFAADYGEWDGTLATLRRELPGCYSVDDATPLLCERRRVIWRG